MDKETKDRIKKLKEEGKYDEIFAEFGSKAYVRNTPRNIKKVELKKLKKEGKYEDIFNKYGKYEYNKILIRAMFNEIREVKGLGSAIAWRIKTIAIKQVSALLAATTIFTTALPAANAKTVGENAEKYATEIAEYNEKIDNYASHVNSMNLSDIQIFMKVMDDMWESIQGYKTPKRDIIGFMELELANEDGYGVCRNMASDVSRKLQEINPDYNARTIAVYLKEGFKIADIERTILETNETVQDTNDEQGQDTAFASKMQEFIGNHMVTLVDVKVQGKKVTLALDPTNPGIGVYKNGEILMLNSIDDSGKPIEFDSKELSTALFFTSGYDSTASTILNFIASFNESIPLDTLNSYFGLEAQNKALLEVRALEAVNDVMKQSSENEFENRIRVDPSQLIQNNSLGENKIQMQDKSMQDKSIQNIEEQDDELEK